MSDLISQAADTEIIDDEVSSQKTYESSLHYPTWSGDSSGVTIGIGYDVGAGVTSFSQLQSDWKGHIPDAMIEALRPCIGVTGLRAKQLAADLRGKVDVPWAAAMAVFEQVDMPKWYGICKERLPNFEMLSLDCRGALVSLTFNRGPSFDRAGDRYTEMRAIKQHMTDKRFDLIPAEIRSMKRLWTDGLVARREREAVLFENGLKKPVPAKTGAPVKQPSPAPSPKPESGSSWGSLLLHIIESGHIHVEI